MSLVKATRFPSDDALNLSPDRAPTENVPMDPLRAFGSVTRLGEPRAAPEPPSIRTSQTATALVAASLKTVSRRPSRSWSPALAIRCPSAALNTTDDEPPARGMDSTVDGVGPLANSTRSPSALQPADPFAPRSTRRRGAEPSTGSTHNSRELFVILSSREPSGVAITKSVVGQTTPELRRVPPTNERSQPVQIAVSHAAVRIFVPSPLQAYTSIPRVSTIRWVSPVSMKRHWMPVRSA